MAEFGVFDIVGPRMIGPSSSHTAGAARLGYIAWKIANRDVQEADITLYGSFAQTGRGHGTDKAITAGVLGMHPDNEDLVRSQQIAKEQGVDVRIYYSSDETDHPNTARLVIKGSNGDVTEVVGTSIGGGNVRITEINGFPVDFTGEYPALLIQHYDVPGIIHCITKVLAIAKINVAFMQVFRKSRGQEAYMIIETDQIVPKEILTKMVEHCEGVYSVRAV